MPSQVEREDTSKGEREEEREKKAHKKKESVIAKM